MFLSLPPVIRPSWRGSWCPKSPTCPQEPQPCGFCHFWNPKSWSRGWIWKQNGLVLAVVSHLVSDVLQFRQQRQKPWGVAMCSVRAQCFARCPGWAVLPDTSCSPRGALPKAWCSLRSCCCWSHCSLHPPGLTPACSKGGEFGWCPLRCLQQSAVLFARSWRCTAPHRMRLFGAFGSTLCTSLPCNPILHKRSHLPTGVFIRPMDVAAGFSWHRLCPFLSCIWGLFSATLLSLFTYHGDSSSRRDLSPRDLGVKRGCSLSALRWLSASKAPCGAPWMAWMDQKESMVS